MNVEEIKKYLKSNISALWNGCIEAEDDGLYKDTLSFVDEIYERIESDYIPRSAIENKIKELREEYAIGYYSSPALMNKIKILNQILNENK